MLSVTSFLSLTQCLAVLRSITYCYGYGLEGWMDRKALELSYFNISTENILRCERLCQYQGKCVAVTFDKKERVCHMHDSYDAQTTMGGAGRYLFKILKDKVKNNKTGCDVNTQIVLPSANSDRNNCYNIEEKGCILYGSTFQVTKGMAIWYKNKEVLVNTTLDACMQKCIEADGYTCKSFDFERAVGTCFLQEVTSHDVPASYKITPAEDYYERDCTQRG